MSLFNQCATCVSSLGLTMNQYPALSMAPKSGDIVLAKYEGDELYYRAVIKTLHTGECMNI